MPDDVQSESEDDHLGVECVIVGCESRLVSLRDGWPSSTRDGPVCADCWDFNSEKGHFPDEESVRELVTDGGVDTAQSGWGESVWSGPERNENAPKRCPHCDRPLAHPDELRDNDNIDAVGLFSAYREHRQAHFSWGDDPREHGERYGDPYLGNYYDTSRDATYEPDDDGPAGDPDEVVGHVFDVDIRYEATVRARVVAPGKQRAKEKAEDLRITDGEDLNGNVPEARLTTQLHTDTTERENVHRADTDLAERMEGWPW